ncbi:hypothetical protein BMYO_1601 [Bifidobacterium myosotis]|uniref:Uncharacterized protein n=1 Tax=Bifidobacterium myosotis TaxID=1630166 RepID=A0A261FHH7_9BIFI|nr:hypothetical protein BMYO_1601 [Bifidobacterium myosotis]
MPSTLTDLSHRIHQPPPIASQPDAHQPSINHPPPNNKQPPTNAKTLGARPEEPDRAPSAMKGRKGESKKGIVAGRKWRTVSFRRRRWQWFERGTRPEAARLFQLLFSYYSVVLQLYSIIGEAECPPAASADGDRRAIRYFRSPTAITARCRTTKTRIMRPTTMVVHSAGTPKSEVSGSRMERTRAPSTEPST